MTASQQPDASLPLIDSAVMAEWCNDLDSEDIAAILSQVPEQCRACLHDIEAAVGQAELSKAKRVAHKLKGMAANLGATRLARFARSIEMESNDVDEVMGRLPLLNATVSATIDALSQTHYWAQGANS